MKEELKMPLESNTIAFSSILAYKIWYAFRGIGSGTFQKFTSLDLPEAKSTKVKHEIYSVYMSVL